MEHFHNEWCILHAAAESAVDCAFAVFAAANRVEAVLEEAVEAAVI